MAQDESDEIVILDWVIDYYCYKFWEEFEKDQRAEMLSDAKFISFVDCLLSFTESKIDQKSERAIFLELLRQLWEAGNVEEAPSPLEVAVGHLDQLIDQYHKNAVILDVDWDSLRLAFKKQAVLLLVKEGYVSRARGLTDRLWPRKKRSDADKELIKSLLEGQKTEEAEQENTEEHFYQEIIPVLRQVHDSFGMPFLAKIMKTKRRVEAQRVATKKVFSMGSLRQVCGREWRDVVKLADKLAKTISQNDGSGDDNRAQRSK
ncbi:uncharacterized protein [Diadema antillarum]|uniref:uncharacterized protein n=1 Tax=Diadema antillarum TaxID=105358 RepID=UPI003A8C6D82